MTQPDDAGRRLSEALHAQASRGPMPQATSRPPAGRPVPPPPPRMPGRVPPPAPRPAPQPAAADRPQTAATGTRQIVWALVITLLVGAILGGGLALVSVLLPGLLPAIG